MKNKVKEANLSTLASKILGGLNINALKILLPLWIAPITGVTIRLCFGAAAFWIMGLFNGKEAKGTTKDKWLLILLGAVFIYGFMILYLIGISMTTPVSIAIFGSLQPIWVFLISALFMHEKVTGFKVFGILLGLGGALLCISTQPSDHLASNAFVGNLLNLGYSLLYAIYLVISGRLVKRVDNITLLKYSFLGAAIVAVIVNVFVGFDAPLFHQPIHWKPMLVLLFVLVFPTTLSYLLIPIGLKYLKTTLVAIYGYATLIVTTFVSFLLGQDRFSLEQAIAIALIVCSVYFVEVAESKRS